MSLKFRLGIAFIISAGSLLGFSLISLFISDQKINRFDQQVISVIQGGESPNLTLIMEFFTMIGSAPVVIVLSLFLLFFLYKILHHRMELILFSGTVIGSAVLNELLKQFFHRVRPELHRLIEVGGFSFPSGHAMNAFTVYGVVSFLLWRHISTRLGRLILIISSAVMILLIGVSRIYLGVHYPSDVIGGYLASCVWLTFAIFSFQFYMEKRYNKKYKREKKAA
jgi:undecaprenyl-diphosphatase